MVNVPHKPEMTDHQAFRRLFTASPACPHEDTPIGGSPERPKPQDSLDLNYAFHSGSPVPPPPKKSTSIQKISKHIKQKVSESRLSKSSSRAESRTDPDRAVKQNTEVLQPGSEGDEILLAISARSTGLSDLLISRNGSVDAYDSDAQSIKTPQLRSVVGTIKLSPEPLRRSPDEREIHPNDSLSNYIPSPKPIEAAPKTPTGRKARSSPYPQTPGKISFYEALQLKESETPSDALQRTSVGVANGSIRPPTTSELRSLKTPPNDKWRLFLQADGQSPSPQKGIDTPQTVIKRLSERRKSEQVNSTASSQGSERSPSLPEQLEPALLEYLSRFSPSKQMSEADEYLVPARTVVSDYQDLTIGPPDRSDLVVPTSQSENDEDNIPPRKIYTERSRADVASIPEKHAHEQSSVHLFNMHISSRLASKSTATMLSPSASGNTSRNSFEAVSAPVISANSTTVASRPTRIRAEHNRRPSDPHTKQLFEQPGQPTSQFWKDRSTSIDRSRIAVTEGDDTSSFYTNDGCQPSSAGNISLFDGTQLSISNPHSVAIGGRSASSEIPTRRVNKTGDAAAQFKVLPARRLSASAMQQQSSTLETASSIISRYVDGRQDVGQPRPGTVQSKPPTEVLSSLRHDSHNSVRLGKPNEHTLQVHDILDRRLSAGQSSHAQRSGRDFNFPDETRPTERKYSTISTIPPEADRAPSPLAESATDMWNRAFREARKDSTVRDLLATPTLEMDALRRPSSFSTPRPKHRKSVLLQTPQTTTRRSQSAGPQARMMTSEDDAPNDKILSGKLKRLSFKHLRQARSQILPRSGAKRLQKRSSPELSKKQSFTASTHSMSRNFRAGNTPPLKELLGMWGSFPSHERAKRCGAAGMQDDVITRDFAIQNKPATESGPNTPADSRTASGPLSAMQSTLRMLSLRSTGMNRRQSRSMSFPIQTRDRVNKSSKVLFINRLRRIYRTRSSEWHGRITAGGHRSSVSAGRAVEYPELEILPGEGLFGRPTRQSINPYAIDGAIDDMKSTARAMQEYRDFGSTPIDTPSWPRIPANDQITQMWQTQSNSSLNEPVIPSAVKEANSERCVTMPEPSTRRKSQQMRMRRSIEAKYRTTPKIELKPRPSAVSQVSRGLRMPGSFGDD